MNASRAGRSACSVSRSVAKKISSSATPLMIASVRQQRIFLALLLIERRARDDDVDDVVIPLDAGDVELIGVPTDVTVGVISLLLSA